MKTLNFGRLATIAATATILALAVGSQPLAAQAGAQAAAPASQGPSLPLSMSQAVAMGLEANLGLKADRLDVDVASHSVAIAKSAFLPQLSAGVDRRSSRSVPSDFTQGITDITGNSASVSGQVRQALPWYGGGYSLTWSGSRSTQDGGISSFNPRLGSTLQVNFEQPLLRGFKTDNLRVGVESAERRRAISDIELEQRVVATEAQVRLAYLNLVAAIESKKVNDANLDIAVQSLNQSKSRVRVGQSPEIEIVQAEAQVATVRVGVIAAEARILTAEDLLRAMILEPTRPDFWQVRLVPTDTIQLLPRDVNLDAVVANALANRLDLQVQRRALDITDLNIALNHNTTLPAVDLNATYIGQGTGGTQFSYGSGFPPAIISQTTKSFGSALGDTFGAAYPTWSVGVSVSYPVGRTGAEAAYAQSMVLKRQQELGIEQLRLQIVAQVRDAARSVQNTFQQVQAAKAAREATEVQLAAEQRRFEVGLSTNLELQVRQRDLAQARITELDAMISYNRAIIQLDRVQKIQ